jgi:hypothetical protein
MVIAQERMMNRLKTGVVAVVVGLAILSGAARAQMAKRAKVVKDANVKVD